MVFSDSKACMRQRLKKARLAMGPDGRLQASMLISDQILRHLVPALVAAGTVAPGATIGLYAARFEEVNLDDATTALLALGYRVALPRMAREKSTGGLTFVHISDLSQLERGPYGIRQPALAGISAQGPVAASKIALLVLPCVGIDSRGNRLGSGLGLYDRYLAQHQGYRLGAAFCCQMVDRIAYDDHDVPLSGWVSEKGIVAGKM